MIFLYTNIYSIEMQDMISNSRSLVLSNEKPTNIKYISLDLKFQP